MPDHIHMLLTPGSDAESNTFGLSQILNSIKGASSHAVNNALGRSGHVWQSESFDHVLRSDESLRATAEYICANPVRAGLVSTEDGYPWLWREWIEGAVLEARTRS
jgi:REP element-mobilizing transposase RayT